ncbi:MAG: D-alanyl-D-alanine carboxypeptidase family protein [Patescibacteria group bacterium]|nr:D-alanyl-D-alanine carboxypeptidase [Patescibacteria group bacterium]
MITTILSLYIASILNPFASTEPVQAMGIYPQGKYLASLLHAAPQPVKKTDKIAPVLKATSSIAVDIDSGKTLFESNVHEKRAIASITKLMTAAIVLDENNLNEVVTISREAASVPGSKIWLYPGEKIQVQNLLYSIIIHSGNDAAWALAEYNAGSVEAFVDKMNEKAKKLGLENTHFTNPAGFDDKDNYSTAYDVSILGRYIYRKSFVRHAAAIKELSVTSVNGDITHNLQSTNDLLDSYLNVKGLKTGHTEKAGLCLVAITENEFGNRILTVMLNSPNRFEETKILTDWAFRSFIW